MSFINQDDLFEKIEGLILALWKEAVGVDLSEQPVELRERGDGAERLSDRLPNAEPLEVPGHVLASLTNASQAFVVAQHLEMFFGAL